MKNIDEYTVEEREYMKKIHDLMLKMNYDLCLNSSFLALHKESYFKINIEFLNKKYVFSFKGTPEAVFNDLRSIYKKEITLKNFI